MADTSKMNNAFRVATLQAWDAISSAAASSNAPTTATAGASSHSTTRKADSVDLFDDIIINTTRKATTTTVTAAAVATAQQSNNLPIDEKNPFGDDADGDNPFGFAEQPIGSMPTHGSQISSSLR